MKWARRSSSHRPILAAFSKKPHKWNYILQHPSCTLGNDNEMGYYDSSHVSRFLLEWFVICCDAIRLQRLKFLKSNYRIFESKHRTKQIFSARTGFNAGRSEVRKGMLTPFLFESFSNFIYFIHEIIGLKKFSIRSWLSLLRKGNAFSETV